MQTLGEVLGEARRSTSDFERWLQFAEPISAEQVRQEATLQACTVVEFARWAVANFDRFADDEAWAQLMMQIRDAEDPGKTCLLMMVNWHIGNQKVDR